MKMNQNSTINFPFQIHKFKTIEWQMRGITTTTTTTTEAATITTKTTMYNNDEIRIVKQTAKS